MRHEHHQSTVKQCTRPSLPPPSFASSRTSISSIVHSVDQSCLSYSALRSSTMNDATLFHGTGRVKCRLALLIIDEQRTNIIEKSTYFPRMYPMAATTNGIKMIAASLDRGCCGDRSPNPIV